MTDDLFDTPEKVSQAITTLSEGMVTPFWKLVCKILDANIYEARRQLEDGSGIEEESLSTIIETRNRLKIYKDIRNTPEDIIKKLQTEDVPEPSDDPYDTVAEELNQVDNNKQ